MMFTFQKRKVRIMAGRSIRKFRGQRSRQKVTGIPVERNNSSDIGRSLMKTQASLRNKRGSARGTYAPDGSANYGQTQKFPK